MRYVQLVLTDVQTGMLASSVKNAMLVSDNDQERAQLAALADFMYAVDASPDAFPVTQPEMRRSLKKRLARAKGPAQPPRKNKRKRTQERKRKFQMRTRAERRASVAVYNTAFEAAQRERAESLGIVLPG